MRWYDIKLSNDESWHLKTEMNLKEVKQYIQNNKWIKLQSYGQKHGYNSTIFIPEESDIQTCNIVYINEDEDFQKRIDEQKQSKKERLEIIHNIDKYEFNIKMKWWFFKNAGYIDKELEHPYLSFNEKFLNVILEKCKEYKCKLKEE